jgi:hypothetical protein
MAHVATINKADAYDSVRVAIDEHSETVFVVLIAGRQTAHHRFPYGVGSALYAEYGDSCGSKDVAKLAALSFARGAALATPHGVPSCEW